MESITDNIMHMALYSGPPTRIGDLDPVDATQVMALPMKTSKRRFPCQQCNLSFTRNASLKRHFTEAHLPQSMRISHTCQHCMKTFPRLDSLSRHISEKHLDNRVKVNCHVCGKLVHRRYLTEHWNTSACHRRPEETSQRGLLTRVASHAEFPSDSSTMDCFWSYADILTPSAAHRDLLSMSPDYAAYYLLFVASRSRHSMDISRLHIALGLTYAVVRHACKSLTGPRAAATRREHIILAICALYGVESRLQRDEAVKIHQEGLHAIWKDPCPHHIDWNVKKAALIPRWARLCAGEEDPDDSLYMAFCTRERSAAVLRLGACAIAFGILAV